MLRHNGLTIICWRIDMSLIKFLSKKTGLMEETIEFFLTLISAIFFTTFCYVLDWMIKC